MCLTSRFPGRTWRVPIMDSASRSVSSVSGQCVQVSLGSPQAAMPKSLLHDLEISATGEQPRGIRMPQIMQWDVDLWVRRLHRRQPHALAGTSWPGCAHPSRATALLVGRPCRLLAGWPGTGRRHPCSSRTGAARASSRSSSCAGSADPTRSARSKCTPCYSWPNSSSGTSGASECTRRMRGDPRLQRCHVGARMAGRDEDDRPCDGPSA